MSVPDTTTRSKASVSVSLFPGYPNEPGVYLSRAACGFVAILICLGMHLFLRRYRSGSTKLLGITLTAMFPVAVLFTLLGSRIFQSIAPRPPGGWQWTDLGMMGGDYITYQWMFLAWGALYCGIAYVDEVRNRDRRLAEAEYSAQQAQLTALRLQINSHFLFNTLNTLAGLVALGRNVEAESILLNLSRFLRYTLAAAPDQFSSVGDEVDLLCRYLDVEKARFSDRLHVRYEIDPACNKALVPALSLLPLAENAIKHGLGEAEESLCVEVGVRREGDALLLWVENKTADNPVRKEGLGIGLTNIRQRLLAIYGADARLEAHSIHQGWRSALFLPWAEQAP